MPNTLTWSYVWPRLLILVAALALVVLSAGGMLYWKLQQTGAEVRLAAAVTRALETANDVVDAAATQTRAARSPSKSSALDTSRKALESTATELQGLSHTLSQAAFRAGGPAIAAAEGEKPASMVNRIANASAVMPAPVLSIWLERKTASRWPTKFRLCRRRRGALRTPAPTPSRPQGLAAACTPEQHPHPSTADGDA
ncbi:MAG: hypothetical protein H6891_05100 [Brucellaceae bacterium]|nr:hypothetical protein [Brucellaceae bacterium]